jgi:hypothetical protein
MLSFGAMAFGQNPGGFIVAPELSFSGNWYPAPHEENLGNPDLIDYLGVPINESARAWALAWNPSRVTLPEHQCQVHVAPYIYGGPMNLRVWEEREPQTNKLVAIRQYISNFEQERTIWMDDRPHPPEWVPHTWMGFSTGKWEGNALTIYTTHIKQGWLRRNGLPESDRATLIEHFMRHGDYLVHVSIVTDPVYLTEPFTRTQVFILDTDVAQNWLYPCDYVVEISGRKQGFVPHYLPGQNPFINEFGERTGLPVEATLGGAETMYPDYQRKLGSAVTKRR